MPPNSIRPPISPPISPPASSLISPEDIAENAVRAADFLKGLASAHRLKILCALSNGEKNVGELMAQTGIAQTSMSQHLSKLKIEGIVTFRRDHRTLYYSIDHPLVQQIIALLYSQFCQKPPLDLPVSPPEKHSQNHSQNHRKKTRKQP